MTIDLCARGGSSLADGRHLYRTEFRVAATSLVVTAQDDLVALLAYPGHDRYQEVFNG